MFQKHEYDIIQLHMLFESKQQHSFAKTWIEMTTKI